MGDSTSRRSGGARSRRPLGGLPDADELDAFGAALTELDAAAQDGTLPAAAGPASSYTPVTRLPGSLAPPPSPISGPEPVRPVPPGLNVEPLPDAASDDAISQLKRQTTIQVPVQVHDRFRAYKKQLALTMRQTPKNEEVIAAALNECDGRFGQIIDARRPKPEPGLRFGRPAPTQPIVSTDPRTQLNFRHPRGEYDLIAQESERLGVSVAALISAVLDEWLPPLPAPAQRRR